MMFASGMNNFRGAPCSLSSCQKPYWRTNGLEVDVFDSSRLANATLSRGDVVLLVKVQEN